MTLPSRRGARWARGLSLGLLLVAAALLSACQKSAGPGTRSSAFHGVDITGASYAQGFDLPDSEGHERRLSDFKGKVVVVFFGYTQCPDVCPTTMTELAQAKRLLGPLGPQVQGVFITVDPERDTADLLTRYVHAFDPSFIALRADAQRTRATAESFHVFYEKVPGDRPGSYTIDHTAGSFVFDRQGRVRLFMRFGMGPKAWADDLSTLIKESPASH